MTVSTPIHLVVPSGAKPTAGLNTTLTRKCSVDKPSNTLQVWTGVVLGKPNSAAPQFMQFADINYFLPNGQLDEAGIRWQGTVTTPSAYGSGGGWNVTQLVNTHRIRTENLVAQRMACNDVLALDNSFGYEPVYPTLYTDNGVMQGSRDAPASSWDSGTGSLQVHDFFMDYTMYMPPGEGSCFVALKSFKWFWQGEAHPNSSGVWQLSNTGGAWSFDEDFPLQPTWGSNAASTFYWEDIEETEA